MKDAPSNAVPPVKPKSTSMQSVGRYEKADTGGDPYDRMRGNYAKTPPAKEGGEEDMLF